MKDGRIVRVDVRDMLCAQALAVVACALEGAASGASLEVVSNTEDVKEDLLAWARQRRLPVREDGPMRLWIEAA